MTSLRIENQHYRSVQKILVHLLGSYARLRNLLKHMTRESRTWSGILKHSGTCHVKVQSLLNLSLNNVSHRKTDGATINLLYELWYIKMPFILSSLFRNRISMF